jgi:hypothetical protein
MKTLDQLDAKLEKRTPISSLPFAITASGSYYLTSNLTGVSGQHGITISVDNVSVDLNGFTMTGVAGAKDGIYASAAVKAIRVHNGTVAQWPLEGIALENASASQLDHLRAIGNHGNALLLGASSTILDCVAMQNLSYGIITPFGRCLVQRCICTGNSAGALILSDSRVEDCNFSGNTGVYGVSLGTGCVISGSTANSNASHGIVTDDGSIVTNCTTQGNSLDGIHAGSSCIVINSSSRNNGTGTTGSGILTDIRASISGCTAIGNKGDGIVFSGDSFVLNNHASTNGGAGFHDVGSASRIDGNVSRENIGIGILAAAIDTVVRNNSVANGNSAANNQYGPTAGANWGPVGNASSTNPWTNF